MAAAAESEAGTDGRVSFDDFIHLLEQAGPAGPLEGPDPKVQLFFFTPTVALATTYCRLVADALLL